MHIAASNGHDSFANIDNLHIDLYHSLEKSTKRKRLRLDCLEFCGHEYLLSEEFADQRFLTLPDAFTNPLTEVAPLLFNS